jgi:hypothetical protein
MRAQLQTQILRENANLVHNTVSDFQEDLEKNLVLPLLKKTAAETKTLTESNTARIDAMIVRSNGIRANASQAMEEHNFFKWSQNVTDNVRGQDSLL